MAYRERRKQIKTDEYITGDGLSFTAWSLPTIVKDEPVEPETGGKKRGRTPEAIDNEFTNSEWNSGFGKSLFFSFKDRFSTWLGFWKFKGIGEKVARRCFRADVPVAIRVIVGD